MRIVAVALLVVVLAGCGSSEEQAAPPQETAPAEQPPTGSMREVAPATTGESLDGEDIALADFRGRPVLINVWSSW